MKTDNELIAEFMGEVGLTKVHKGKIVRYIPSYKIWQTLMPVIEKISEFVYEEYEENNGLYTVIIKDRAYPRTFGMRSPEGKPMFRFNRQILFDADKLIDAAYDACVDFIKWYNQETKTKT